MSYALIIRDDANEDMAQAFLYYDKIQKGLGEDFYQKYLNFLSNF